MHPSKYNIKVNNPLEDPFVYYEDNHGIVIGKIQLVKGAFWGKKGKIQLDLESLKFRNNDNSKLSIEEYILVMKRIISKLESHDLNVELI